MDLKICGLIDILLIVGLIIFLILGYKKGFVKKVVSFIGIIAVLIFSVLYCGQFANFLTDKGIIYPSIHDNIYNNAYTGLTEKLNGAEPSVHNALVIGLGIPGFIADMLEKQIGGTVSNDPTAIANTIADAAAKVAMIGIAFLILVVGIFLICGILKLIASLLRKNALVRFVDGSLGALLYASFYMLVVLALFALLRVCYDKEWFTTAKTWFDTDMGISYNAEGEIETFHWIGITRYIFNGNILVNLFHLFF